MCVIVWLGLFVPIRHMAVQGGGLRGPEPEFIRSLLAAKTTQCLASINEINAKGLTPLHVALTRIPESLRPVLFPASVEDPAAGAHAPNLCKDAPKDAPDDAPTSPHTNGQVRAALTCTSSSTRAANEALAAKRVARRHLEAQFGTRVAETVRALIEAGANVETPTRDGETALMLCMQRHQPWEVVFELLVGTLRLPCSLFAHERWRCECSVFCSVGCADPVLTPARSLLAR